jgi:hypothetical protein
VSVSATDLALEAEAARGEFLDAVHSLTPAQSDASQLVGDWSLREIVAHMGYWVGNTALCTERSRDARRRYLAIRTWRSATPLSLGSLARQTWLR